MSEELRELHLRGATGPIRMATLHGTQHMVVPVIALMEGVIHAINAETPEFVPHETLAHATHMWNNRPAVLKHPTRNGKQISANTPDVVDAQGLGSVYQAEVKNKQLVMEAYIDPAKAERLGAGDMIRRLRAGESVEVSVGAYVVTEPRAGEHNGKPYKAIWKQIWPDHLAFLPDGIGACSVKMGCGTRAAEAYLVTAEGFEALGDKPGHPFHGNQWTHDGEGSVEEHTKWLKDRAYIGTKTHGPDVTVTSTEVKEGTPTRPYPHHRVHINDHFIGTVREGVVPRGMNFPWYATTRGGTNLGEFHTKYHAVEGLVKHYNRQQSNVDIAQRPHMRRAEGADMDTRYAGGKGSGDFGHGGRPGKVGGSTREPRYKGDEVKGPPTPNWLKGVGAKGDPIEAEVQGYHLTQDEVDHVRHTLDAAHTKELQRTGLAETANYGAGQDYDSIFSKTDQGGLSSSIDLDTGKVTHDWHGGDPGTAKSRARHPGRGRLGERILAFFRGFRASEPEPEDLTDAARLIDDLDVEFDGVTGEQAEEFAEKWAEVAPKMLKSGGEHPFTYCMEVIVPAMEREGKGPSDPEAFCGWWKAEHAEAYFGEGITAAGKKPCGCHQEETMNNDVKSAAIKLITETKDSGFTAADVKTLEAWPDKMIENIKTLVETKATVDLKAAEDKKAADDKAAEEKKQAELKAAEDGKKPPTEDEWMKTAPESIRTLVTRHKKADAAKKLELVASLKAAQSAYSEDELKAMDVEQLEKLASIAKVDYSGRGTVRHAEDNKDDVFLNPPDPYAIALKARAAAEKVQ